MPIKGSLDIDARGLIYEAYRIDGITEAECRTIFLDWALGAPEGDQVTQLRTLLAEYGAEDHPMTRVLREGIERAGAAPKRRGGRAGRHGT